MRKTARLFLFLFFSFLIVPTVVCAIEDSLDISLNFDFSEDEQAQKEIKMMVYYVQTTGEIYLLKAKKKTVTTENNLDHDVVFLGILKPPPQII